jgi:hypothetical protein
MTGRGVNGRKSSPPPKSHSTVFGQVQIKRDESLTPAAQATLLLISPAQRVLLKQMNKINLGRHLERQPTDAANAIGS